MMTGEDLLALLDSLGARQTALRLRRELRRQGTLRIPAGPTRATAANPAGLSNRQVEVLPVVQGRAAAVAVVEVEAQGPHQPQPRAGRHARPPDRADVGGDLRAIQDDVEHGSSVVGSWSSVVGVLSPDAGTAIGLRTGEIRPTQHRGPEPARPGLLKTDDL